ncbi:MAG: hypothetical protein J6U00_10555 [Ruminococcus sp.]|uniref:hypothetical protein n=1 Tax=Ruminococcus sp. TaxID=41978 RepID=UPI001B120CB6|nr:hypothetical protein [Ruminococcus sp.]MBO7474417.1 hypothetical protein [Ruminococcus sp.]
MKRTIVYLSLGLAVFLFSLLMLYIGFISPAKSDNSFPFIRMTVCLVLSIAGIALFTRYIHPVSGLAGLDSAWLNLSFTISLLLSLFVQVVTFGNSNVEPYLSGLAEKNAGATSETFYGYIKYVFMGGHALIAVRTFIHSAFLGLLKAIMKHAE